MDYEITYKEALEKAKKKKENSRNLELLNFIEDTFPELKESKDERIRKWIIGVLSTYEHDKDLRNVAVAWLEKQGNKDSQVTIPTFTFDDVFALQCCMETVKKVQEDNELYEQLQSLHDRLHDAYWLEKEGKQKTAEWDEEDENEVIILEAYIRNKEWSESHIDRALGIVDRLVNKVKSLRPKQGEQKPTDKIHLGKEYKCIASPRYSTFMTGKIYKPEDKFLCSLMNFCSDCFEPIEDSEQIDLASNTDKVESKFHEGDTIVEKDFFECSYETIKEIKNGKYIFTDGSTMNINAQDGWLLVKPHK